MVNPLHTAFYLATFTVGLFSGILLGHLNTSSAGSSSTFLWLTTRNATITLPGSDNTSTPAWQAPPALRDYEPLGVESTDDQWWENFESNRTLYLSAVAGIGNTLQSMASAFRIAIQEKIKMKFVFYRHDHGYAFGPARWDELFSFPKINADYTFPDGEVGHEETKACGDSLEEIYLWSDELKNTIEWRPEPDGSGEYYCFKASQWKERPFPKSALWFYRILRPAEELQQYINLFKKQTEWDKYQWIGVHVRRSDNAYWMEGELTTETQDALKDRVNKTDLDTMIPVEHYIKAMKKLEEEWPIHNFAHEQRVKPPRFFLATDNDEVKQNIAHSFEAGKVVSFRHQLDSRDLRKEVWGIKAAVIDLYLLASCRVFIGTPFSTFSEAAHLIGNNLYLEVDFEYSS